MERHNTFISNVLLFLAVLVAFISVMIPPSAYAESKPLVYRDENGVPWNYRIIPSGSFVDSPDIQINTVEITGCEEIPEDGILRMPSSIGGLIVSSVGIEAFCNDPDKDKIKQVVFSENLLYIQPEAFKGCSNLKKVEFSEGLRFIQYRSFQGSGLEEVVLPDGLFQVTQAFKMCKDLRSVTLPKNFSGSFVYAFTDCDSLTEYAVKDGDKIHCAVDGVVYSKDMRTINAYPCGKDDESFIVPKSVDAISDEAFYGSKLKEIILPDGLKTIGDSAFTVCKRLTSIDIPEGVRAIPYHCFGYCDKLETVNLKEGLVSIEDMAFTNCGKLKGIDIPSTVRSIGNGAFAVDHMITHAVIPKGVTSIGESTFEWCKSLEYVSLPDSLKSIGYRAFYCANESSKLKNLYIPEKVETIDDSAFENCSSELTVYSINPVAAEYAEAHGINFVVADRDRDREITGAPDEYGPDDPGDQGDEQEGDDPGEQGEEPGNEVLLKKQKITGTFTYSRAVGRSFKLKVKAKTRLSFKSSNTKIATVSKSGKVTIKGVGKCKITVTAAESSEYMKAVKRVTVKGILAKPSIKAKARSGNKVRITWSKVDGADGYELYVRQQEQKKYKKVLRKKARVKGVMHRGLTAGRKYSYKVRAFKKSRGKIIYSKFSKARTVRVK